MAKIVPSIIGNNPPEHQDYYSPNLLQEQQSNQATANRPISRNKNDNQINWLGSSYSGADIKVVAHLYTTPQETDEIVRLQQELEEVRSSSTACRMASQGLPTDLTGLSRLTGQDSATQIARLGGVQPDSPAGMLLISIFRAAPRSGNWTSMRSHLMQAYVSQAVTLQLVGDALQLKINSLNEIRQKSTNTIVLGTLQTISVQTYREKVAVRALGHSYPKGMCRGNRTIAGSMIFTLFNEHSLAQLIRSMSATGSIYGEMNNDLSAYIADQLPPFDLTIIFANEYGSLSQMSIYGVEFISDGMTLSIEDLLTEQVLQFIARDIDIMTSQGNIRLSRAQRGMHFSDEGQEIKASDLPFTSKEAYSKYLERLGIRRKRTQW
jgi:hypothetical protein